MSAARGDVTKSRTLRNNTPDTRLTQTAKQNLLSFDHYWCFCLWLYVSWFLRPSFLRSSLGDLRFCDVYSNAGCCGDIIHCQVFSTSSTAFEISLSVKRSAEAIEDCESEASVAAILAWKSSCVWFTCRTQRDVGGVWLPDGVR